MTTITLPRATVEQVLEAWDGGDIEWFKRAYTVMENLRAALAQQAEPVEPVAWEGWWLHHGQHNYRAKPLTSERVKELMKLAFEVGREAAPPQRKPLSEEEIKDCETQAMVNGALPFEQRVFFARAIERAHGIGGQE